MSFEDIIREGILTLEQVLNHLENSISTALILGYEQEAQELETIAFKLRNKF